MKSPSVTETNPAYRRYVLWVLTIVYTFNFIDRQILVILQEPIKESLQLSDTQLGLLTGFAFAIFYVTLGIPIARLADSSNRKNIVAVSLTIWSAMTAISGLAQNFTHLLLARIGVGIGEAGGSPPSHAIISDYYPPEKRATALSTYSLGIYLGIFLGFIVGGFVGKMYGWRVALYALGIPGVLFALVVYFTVKEPIRGMSDAAKYEVKESFWTVVKLLLSKKTFVYAALGSGFGSFTSYGVGNFFPSFLSRVHGLDIQEAGIVLGLCIGVGGIIGTYLGGFLADRNRSKSIKWYLWLGMAGAACNLIPATFAYFGHSMTIVVIALFFSNIFLNLYLGPTIAATHSLVPAHMRAMTSAILFFILNLIGLGCGPLVIGLLSDWLEPTYGAFSLRYAFTITYLTGVITAVLFYLAAQHYEKDLGTLKK